MNLLTRMGGAGKAFVAPVQDITAMPTTDSYPFTLIHTEHFLTNFAEGAYRTTMGTTWDNYNGYPTTIVGGVSLGVVDMATVASVTASVLQIRMYKPVGDVAHTGVITPWDGVHQTYGKYSWRFYESTVNADYKIAWLLWPVSEVWAEGEIDFPEGGIGNTWAGFIHDVTGTPSNNIVAYVSAVSTQQWHTGSIEWTPTAIRFLIDGAQVSGTTNPAGIPITPMRWALQNEPTLQRPYTITDGSTSYVYIDWLAAYSYNP